MNPPLRLAAEKKSTSPATKPAPAPAAKPAALAPAVAMRRQPETVVRTTTGSVIVRDNHAEFKVNGIAWQKESSSRLAVVNGVAVTQGATVDGAKVVEILPDRVRLSQGGRTFEVVLGKINTYR
jgi:general secretion pathway protein B